MFTKSTLAAALLALSLGAAAPLPALASDYEYVSAELRQRITQKLTAEGYEIRRIESEDGLIEVYAIKDGQLLELYLDGELNIVLVKRK